MANCPVCDKALLRITDDENNPYNLEYCTCLLYRLEKFPKFTQEWIGFCLIVIYNQLFPEEQVDDPKYREDVLAETKEMNKECDWDFRNAVNTIFDDPLDNAHRLVLSDWMEERGKYPLNLQALRDIEFTCSKEVNDGT